jgi:geranylgeranyl pyrophosphate synthase
VQLILDSGGLRDSMAAARKRSDEAKRSIAVLPASPWKDAMLDLAAYSVARNH